MKTCYTRLMFALFISAVLLLASVGAILLDLAPTLGATLPPYPCGPGCPCPH